MTINIGVIGYGYWGPNLARNFAESNHTRLAAIADLQRDRLEEATRRHPSARVTNEYQTLLSDAQIDAIAIASPLHTHFDLAIEALRAGKHVLVEKPLARTSEDILRLMNEAERRQLVLLVDHTFVYTPAVQKIHDLLADGTLGEAYYVDSVRINLGLFQSDINVLWDLAVHDLSIIDYILGLQPAAVSATGINHVSGGPENLAYMTLFYPTNLIAHIHVNWLAPVKVRRAIVGGSRRMLVYDDLEPSEKIKIYDKGITLNGADGDRAYQMRVGYRSGDMWAPRLQVAEALQTEVQHFADCIVNGARPLSGALEAYRVTRVLEAASESMKERGKLVEVQLEPVLA